MDLLDRVGFEVPVVQAGMAGGLATGALAGAVSAAGGLGTVGLLPPEALRDELQGAREQAGDRPIAVNLLTEFTKRAHVDAAVEGGVSAAVLHGPPGAHLVERLRGAGIVVLATIGTVDEARAALARGVDGLVVQGIEAGGHLVGVEPALDALGKVRDLTGSSALWVAGGIADADDTRRALDAGAAAVVAGSRFLLTDESRAHPGYKQRVVDAERTLETLLFGFGWPMRHRVIPNAATDRWCRRDDRGPRAVTAVLGLTRPLRHLPLSAADSFARRQRTGLPVFGPSAPTVGAPDHLLDAAALYAGDTALRLDRVIPAARAVAELAGTAPRHEQVERDPP